MKLLPDKVVTSGPKQEEMARGTGTQAGADRPLSSHRGLQLGNAHFDSGQK